MTTTKPIYSRPDGSYVIERNGYPYHVIASDPLMAEVKDYLVAHPEALVPEPAPHAPSHAEIKAAKISALNAELDALDRKAIRPIRAEMAGTATVEDIARLSELEKSAVAIRAELATLNG